MTVLVAAGSDGENYTAGVLTVIITARWETKKNSEKTFFPLYDYQRADFLHAKLTNEKANIPGCKRRI